MNQGFFLFGEKKCKDLLSNFKAELLQVEAAKPEASQV